MSPNSALNLAQYIGQWLTSEDTRTFFRKSKRNVGVAVGDLLGLEEEERSTKPAILQVRAGIVSTAMHHPVSIHLFMIWGLLGVMWTAASEHPKRSEDREKALKRIFDPEEYRDVDMEIAESDSGEPQVLKIHNRNIRAFKYGFRRAETSHWCLQVGEYYFELRDPASLTDEKTQEVRQLSGEEELFNTGPAGEESKGIWFLITKGKTFSHGWEVLYECTTSHSHRRIRARAKRMYEQHFADSHDKSQYNLWVNNCQTFATFLAIAISEPEERRAIVNQTLTSKSTFWLSAVGSVFASIYFYWCKKVIEEVKPHVEEHANKSSPSAFWTYTNEKLAYIDQRWDYYYLHPQVMLQRQQFLNQTLGPKRASQVKRLASDGFDKMKEMRAQKHEWTRLAQSRYHQWKGADSVERSKHHDQLEDGVGEQRSHAGTDKAVEEAGVIEDPKKGDPHCVKAESHSEDLENSSEGAPATDKSGYFDRILTKKQQIHDKKQEMKGRIWNRHRRVKGAEDVITSSHKDDTPVDEDHANPKGPAEDVVKGANSLKGHALVDNLGSNDNAQGAIDAKLSNEDQKSVEHDATDMATAEMMAQLVLDDSEEVIKEEPCAS